MAATQTFTDFMDVKRVTGEEWLITLADAEAYIPDVNEEVIFLIKRDYGTKIAQEEK